MKAKSLVESAFTEKEMSAELSGILHSTQFLQWLGRLEGEAPGKTGQVKMTVERLYNGYCEDLAVYLHYKYGADLVHIDGPDDFPGHYFARLNGKFFDVLNPLGASKPSEMEYFKMVMKKNSKLTPDVIDSYLSDEWDSPTIYTSNEDFFR